MAATPTGSASANATLPRSLMLLLALATPTGPALSMHSLLARLVALLRVFGRVAALQGPENCLEAILHLQVHEAGGDSVTGNA